MTITLTIPPDVETQVRQAAGKAGITPDKYIVNVLEQHLQQGTHKASRLSKTEATLLEQINLGVSQETWQRYRELVKKRRAETLGVDEQKVLIGITDEIETANARRMSALVELAQLRKTSLDAVMDDLGIKAPGYD